MYRSAHIVDTLIYMLGSVESLWTQVIEHIHSANDRR